MNKLLYYFIATLGMGAMLLQVINVAAWNRFWPFFAGIVVNLVAGIAQFVRFLLLSHRT